MTLDASADKYIAHIAPRAGAGNGVSASVQNENGFLWEPVNAESGE